MHKLRKTLAALGAVLLCLATGFIGLAGIFSDLGPGETESRRYVFIASAYAIGCGVAGALLPRRWYVAAIAAWGPAFLGLPDLMTKLSEGGEYPHWRSLLEDLLVIPAMALLFGFLGSMLRRGTTKRRTRAA